MNVYTADNRKFQVNIMEPGDVVIHFDAQNAWMAEGVVYAMLESAQDATPEEMENLRRIYNQIREKHDDECVQ